MSLQQGDVLLFQTNDDGDIESVNGVVTMTCGFETAVYTSMFSGADWWGDLEEQDPDFKYPSETEQVLESMAAVPANLRAVEEAALRDLGMFINQKIANTVEVVASMPGVDTVRLNIRIEARGEVHEFEFTENWSCEGAASRLVPADDEVTIPASQWVQQGDMVAPAGATPSPFWVTSNAAGDVVVAWVNTDDATESILKRTGGAGSYDNIATTWPLAANAALLAYNEGTGDLFATSGSAGTNDVHVAPGGLDNWGVAVTMPDVATVCATASLSNTLYVLDESDNIFEFANSTGSGVAILGYPGGNPHIVAVRQDTGELYVLDLSGFTIYMWNGVTWDTWGTLASIPDVTTPTLAYTVTNQGVIYATAISSDTLRTQLFKSVDGVNWVEVFAPIDFPFVVQYNATEDVIYVINTDQIIGGTTTNEIWKYLTP